MIKVGLCGYGTIGHGVKALIDPLKDAQIVKVFDLPSKKAELGDLLVSDYREIIQDPSIDVVIECLGGDLLPYTIITSALKAKKSVISSNKETISKHYKEYMTLAENNHVFLQFEASVGGGIPLLYPLDVLSRFDSVGLLQGILNGTTNFILSEIGEGASFVSALKEAQTRGFAEKDPTADLEGLDLLRKSAILGMLLYHREVISESIPHFGIAHLPEGFVSSLKKEGRVLKMIVDLHPYQEGLSILIAPTLLKEDDPLSSVKEETNAVSLFAQANGPLSFSGKGAGEFPTASAILSDLERLILHSALPVIVPKEPIRIIPDLEGVYEVHETDGGMKRILNPSLDELRRYDFVAKVAE